MYVVYGKVRFSVRSVRLSVILSVCLRRGPSSTYPSALVTYLHGDLPTLLLYLHWDSPTHMRTPPPTHMGTPSPSPGANLIIYTWGPPDMFRLIYYVSYTSISKWAISRRLNDLVTIAICSN